MTDEMKKQIKDLAFKGYYRKIVDLILAVPEGDRDLEMNLQLAAAYNESKQYPKAIKTLESIKKDGEGQALWHYQMGVSLYCKDKFAQAEESLSKAASIVSDEDFDLKHKIKRLLDKARFQVEYMNRLGGKEEFLPKDFPELMREGDLDKLKKVYEKCAIVAHLEKDDRWTTPFFYDTPCTEFYQWLVEQGLDINAANQIGGNALTERSRSRNTNFEGLLKAGADTYGTKSYNPLYYAIRFDNVENVRLLIEYGANVNPDNLHEGPVKTPLDWVLKNMKYNRVIPCAEMAEMLLDKGAKYTLDAKKIVEDLNKDFEFSKKNIHTDDLRPYEDAMQKICSLFGLEPAEALTKHDGISPIVVAEEDNVKAFESLYYSLVPEKGACETVQGELIRLSGSIRLWLIENGGDKTRWKSKCEPMVKSLSALLQKGYGSDNAINNSIKELVDKLTFDSEPEEADPICDLCVEWIRKNPESIKNS